MASPGQDPTPTTPGGTTKTSWAKAKATASQMNLQAAMEDLETKGAKLEKEVHDYRVKLEEKEEKLSEKTAQVEKLSSDLERSNSNLTNTRSELAAKISECQSSEESAKSSGERADRQAAESDALREEISRLTKSNVEYKEKLVGLEAQAKLGDSEVIPLRYQVQRLTSEMDSMTNHTKWLESELTSKNEQLAAVRSAHASEVAELRSELDGAIAEKESTSGNARNLKFQVEQMQTENERLSSELRDTRRTASDEKLAMKENLVSTERLANLYKEQLHQLQQRYDSAANQMESLQKVAKQAEEESDKEMQERERALEAKAKKVLENQAQDYEKRVGELREQLEAAESRCKKAEEGILLMDVPARKRSPQNALAISNKGVDDEPLNLTDLHTRLAQTQDALNDETLRRKKAEIQSARILAEIEANAPVFARQRQEYDLAMEREQDYRKRLDESLAEVQSARDEASEISLETTRLRKQNKELQEEVTELAKQVQTLLVSRSTGVVTEGSTQIPISVAEIQTQNQQLLKEHRRLTATIDELKAKLDSDNLRRKVENYEREISTLTEDRKQQQAIVEGIVQQRDLYRAILNKQDKNLLGSQEEVSALQIAKQQSERSKSLEEHTKQLEAELSKTRSELDSVNRGAEASKERLARYESLNGELTGTVDRLQLQVSSSKADGARSEADASFHRDKCARLEERLERTRDEVAQVTAAKNEMQRINSSLQSSVSKANAENSRMESELQQAKVKLRLAETQAATAKNAEQRLADENKQLRLENSKQGGLAETMLRLEASLSARNAAESDVLRDETKSLKEKVSSDAAAHSIELEKAKGTIADQETRIKELEQQMNDALKDSLKAKRDSLEANSEVQKLTIKTKTIESQLQLAKKKLGETSDDKDTEGDLSAKVASLTAELEAKRTECETLKERVGTFEKLAKDNEAALADLNKATSATKTAEAEEVGRLKTELETAQVEMSKRKELITELTNDLAKNRDERTEALAEKEKTIAVLRDESETQKKNAVAAEGRYAELASEVSVLKKEFSTSQNNYERELALHATARTELRAAREEAEAEIRLRKIAEEQAASAKSEMDGKVGQFEQQKATLEKNLAESEKALADIRAQNKLLHDQCEKIGDQLEKLQAAKTLEKTDETTAEGSADELLTKKTITDLREIVKYGRSENEMIQAQLDEARRTADRERAATTIAKRSLDEAREEIKVLQENAKGVEHSEVGIVALNEKLRSAQEQAQLLKDSNSHLRDEVARLEKKSLGLENELGTIKKSAQPSEKHLLEVEAEKAALQAEKDSLFREVNDWKGRVQSLVSKFNQVDPEEHAKVLKRIEIMEKEVGDLKTSKHEAEEESKRIRTIAGKASAQFQQQKSLVETQKKSIAKLTAEKALLTKAQKDAAPAKELGELKAKVTKLESERENEKIQLTGANEMNEKLRDRLRHFQKKISDLKKKETTLTTQLKEAQETIEKQKHAPSAPAPVDESKESKPGAAARDEKATLLEGTAKGDAKTQPSDTAEVAKASDTPLPQKKAETVPSKKADNIVPMVPAEGFKFGPSPPEDEKQPSSLQPRAKIPVPGSQGKAHEAATVEAPNAPLSKKRPAVDPPDTESEAKKIAKVEEASEKQPEVGQSAKKPEAESGGETTAVAQKTQIHRRNSSENKEMSMKERLLEKKRKLMLLQKKKEEMEAKVKKDETDAPSPAPKKAKPSSGETADATAASEAAATTVVVRDEQVKDEKKSKSVAANMEDQEEGEEAEAEQGEVEETNATEQETKEDTAKASTTIHNPFGAPVSSTAAPVHFGSTSQTTTAAAAIEGASGSGAATAFGKPTPTFGSGASFGTTSFGKQAEGAGMAATSSGGFGAKKLEGASAAVPSGFGSFANIKPPGTSPAPPAFTFGTSGSITLPTPSSISPQQSMFNAFSSPSPFNTGGVTPLPLFGAKKEKSDEEGKADKEEGGTKDTAESEEKQA